ncbi:hypothetical protein YH66_12055 [[Brevibacterium] flavum]|uniref:DUF2303 domain-containing protein n=1 Tax=[Brevibacterium] flavum TaxID=92706 RepID=A0A0F6Z6Q1_9CORY|nr:MULTISPECIES: DUF2303 family protein [Corynebacterium]AKF28225.1 hypothetical protein YH66_12055 [[Brevibacterium] flavum]AST21474.1 DUF2303 domain-containing protein [Corynebacterium glutamicum ATCC 14067]KIH73020.1 hypothetical protein SD36_12110 [Corynebacterium glutamicum]QJS16613.1 DUF2303 family protein [Corynebacterium glutamicum]QXU45140.1 YfdQ family protein [[Brevibacterium] flavum]
MSHFNENEDTENGVVMDLALSIADRSEEIIAGSEDSVLAPIAVHSTVHKQDERLDFRTHEKFLADPIRRRGTTFVKSVESLKQLEGILLAGEEDNAAVTFSDLKERKITTVINFASWKDHRIQYSTDFHPDFAMWLKLNDQFMNQMMFAEMLQDLRHTIVEPTAADVMQIARTFTATKTAEFESGVRVQSGDVRFSYVENTKAKTTGEIEIPEQIILRLPIFRDSIEPIHVHLDFRYDANENGLKLGYRILNLEFLVEGAWAALVEQAQEGLQSPVLDGPAPAAVQAWE